MEYHFEWDPGKARQNIRKHRISFQRATTIFRDPYMISIFDEEHSQAEERWVSLGKDEHDMLLVVCHTFREITESQCTIRVISARKAIKNEHKCYEE